MISLRCTAAAALLAIFANAVNGASLTAPKGEKVLTVGVIGGKLLSIQNLPFAESLHRLRLDRLATISG